MKRLALIVLGSGLLGSFAVVSSAQDDSYPADTYATCAACHLPDGAGVPGAFPPIRNRAAAIAALEGGREYLIAVVAYGLMGTIQVEGTQYFGVMAGNAGAMSPEEIAAALNYVVFELNENDASGNEPFTASEVENVQAGIVTRSPAGAGTMRPELAGKPGEQWP